MLIFNEKVYMTIKLNDLPLNDKINEVNFISLQLETGTLM